MKPITYQQIRQTCSAKPLTPTDPVTIQAICHDSRAMADVPSLFVALRGERFDGHQHLVQAAGGGAVVALVERMPDVVPPTLHLLQVADCFVAMAQLARFMRKQMRCKVVAVAGSNGKTGTKHLIDAALRDRLRGSVSPRSFNNNVGVPLTIFGADPNDDYLVLEMGTNHPGEIRPLSEMALPDIAVITNCGAEHLEGLGDIRGVRQENAHVLDGLNPGGMLVVNGDDRDLVEAVSRYPGQVVTFGFNPTNDFFATDVRCDEAGVKFKLNGRRELFIPLLGRHTACNALAAIAVARKLMVPEEAIFDGLTRATGPDMRLQIHQAGPITILNDAYNANPNSMRAAIETVAELKTSSRRIAVLGDMRELGDTSEGYHREIGAYAATAGHLDLLVCVGQESQKMADAAVDAGLRDSAVVRYPDSATAAERFPEFLRQGDLVLIKASRGIRLEAVAKGIAQKWDPEPAATVKAAG